MIRLFPPDSPHIRFDRYRAVTARISVICAGCLAGGVAHGAVINGTFDAGLDGWRTGGSLFSTGAQGVITDQTDRRALLWQVVTLPPGAYVLSFDLLGSLGRVGGVGTLPDVFFASLYFAPEAAGFDPVNLSGFDATLPVLDFDFRGVTALGTRTTTGPSPKGASWLRISMPFELASGSVAPLFEVNDLNFIPSDSVAVVDNVSIALVPEPSVTAFGLAACAAAFGRRRRTFSI